MKFFTGIMALALAASGATAAPGTLETRQAGTVYIEFYGEGGCQGPVVEDTVYFDDGSNRCIEERFTNYASFRVARNEASRQLNLYSNPLGPNQCTRANGGNAIDVAAGHVECYTGRIRTVQFGDLV
jgi:hypothetical protein